MVKSVRIPKHKKTTQLTKQIKQSTGRFPILDKCLPTLVHCGKQKTVWSCNKWHRVSSYNCFSGIPWFIVDVQQVWFFALDPRLRLNLTFTAISFSSGLLYCDQGNITVYSRIVFLFCGHISRFSLFLQDKRVDVSLQVMTDVHFKLNSVFSVIDQNMLSTVFTHKETLMKNTKELYRTESLFKPNDLMKTNDSVVCCGGKFTVYSYFIRVRKVHHITIRMLLELNHTIFDGPGYLSNVLMAEQNLYSSSTFQCVVQFMTNLFTTAGRKFFVYDSKATNISLSVAIHLGQRTSFLLPTQNCPNNPCALSVWTEPNFQVNVTVTRITYSGETSFTCQYGGLVAGEELTGDYKESETLCKTHSGAPQHHRHFYSFNSSLILVLFWFEKYSNISVVVLLSQTKCKPVYFDTCLFHAFCTANQRRTDDIWCHYYLKYIAQFSDIQLIRKKLGYLDSIFAQLGALVFYLEGETCSIVQFIRGQNLGLLKSGHLCKIDVIPLLKSDSDTVLLLEIEGSFPQFLTNPHQYTSFVDCIQFDGFVQRFCNQTHCLQNKQIKDKPKCNMGMLFSSAQIHAKQSSYDASPFTVHLSFTQQSHSWMSILFSSKYRGRGSLNTHSFKMSSLNQSKSFDRLQSLIGHENIILNLNSRKKRLSDTEKKVVLQINITTFLGHKPRHRGAKNRRDLFARIQMFRVSFRHHEVRF